MGHLDRLLLATKWCIKQKGFKMTHRNLDFVKTFRFRASLFLGTLAWLKFRTLWNNKSHWGLFKKMPNLKRSSVWSSSITIYMPNSCHKLRINWGFRPMGRESATVYVLVQLVRYWKSVYGAGRRGLFFICSPVSGHGGSQPTQLH